MHEYILQDLRPKESSNKNLAVALQEAQDRMSAEINHRQEMEQLRKQITEDVLAQIRIRFKTEGIKELNDLLNGLGK